MEKDIIKIRCVIMRNTHIASALCRGGKVQYSKRSGYEENRIDVLLTEENVSSFHPSLNIGQTVQLLMLDNSRKYDFDKIRQNAYGNTDIVLMNFDLSSPRSLSYLRSLLPVKKQYLQQTPVVVGGMKPDRLRGKMM